MRRRRPRKTGYRPRSRVHQKFDVLSNRLGVTKVMELLHQAVEQRLFPEEADSRAGLSSAFSLRYRQGLARRGTPSTTRWLPPDPLIAAPARLRPPAGQPSGRIDR